MKRLDTLRIASVGIGYNEPTKFQERLNDYAPVEHFYLKKESDIVEQQTLLSALKNFNLVIVAIQNTSIFPSNKFGVSPSTLAFIDSLQQHQNIILDLFSNPYALSMFKKSEKIKSIVMSYEDNNFTYDLSAQLIFGGIAAKGKLPISASSSYPINTGIENGCYPFKIWKPQGAWHY